MADRDVVEKFRDKFDVSTFERSSFVGKLVLRREVYLLTPRRRALARNVQFLLYFPRTSIPISYQPGFAIIDSKVSNVLQTMETTIIGTKNGR